MPNMSYCMFENTYSDLKDCYKVLKENGGVEITEEEANFYEKPYIKKVINLCKKITEEFGEKED